MSRFFPLLSLALLFLLASFADAQGISPEEQKAVMAKFQAHRAEFPSLTADFTEERTSRLLTTPIVSNGTINFQVPNKFRREMHGDAPSLTVCNGTELYIYYPKFKQAEKYTLGQQRFFDDSIAALTAGLNFQNVDKFFRMAVSKAGAGYEIALTPRSGSLKKILTSLTVWLDAEGNLQRTDAVLPKGDRVVTVYKNVHPAKTSEAKFDFTPPAGATVTTPLGK
jgi:outer membrane lipoprotein-sorting protein